MTLDIMTALGGLGLFLLGMSIMTNGLKEIAGSRVRDALARFTATPASGAAVGAVTTACVQSSSITTVTAIGFVGAGLITFGQSLGIIFGANIGTTVTGWVVAIFGFKLKLAVVMMPAILAGALLRLFAPNRVRHMGSVLAGFGLLFVGITNMQAGMAPFSEMLTPSDFPEETFQGKLLLVLTGMIFTAITQSSSAGVAMSMVALGANMINFPQAAALVVGMDVGTTVTAALATTGGSVAMRRTGFAHVIYNFMTGVVAFLCITPFATLVEPLLAGGGEDNAQLGIAAFHTFFNMLGVVLILGFTKQFSRLMYRLFPEKPARYTSQLDEALLRESPVAVEAAFSTAGNIWRGLFLYILYAFNRDSAARQVSGPNLDKLEEATRSLQSYLDNITLVPGQKATASRYTATVHILDHCKRLLHRCRQDRQLHGLFQNEDMETLPKDFAKLLSVALQDEPTQALSAEAVALRSKVERKAGEMRSKLIAGIGTGKNRPASTLASLDAIRWLDRSVHHVSRILSHCVQFGGESNQLA